MGLKTSFCLYVLLASLAVVFVDAQTCTTSDNYIYDTQGDLVTLYNIASASACCAACSNFVETQAWSYCKGSQASYGNVAQNCICKSGNSYTLTSNSGYTSGKLSRAPYVTPGVSCGAQVVGTDFNNGFINPSVYASSASGCCAACENVTGCNYWAYASNTCYLKATNANAVANSGVTSGSLSVPVAPLRTGTRGLAWFNSQTCTDILALPNLSWLYNWAGTPPANIIQCMLAHGIEYIPMQAKLPLSLNNIYVAPNTKHLLTFNEPNFVSQANILPADAAAAWPAIQTFANSKGLLIGSPAAAAGGNTDPIAWLHQFFGNCSGCQVDFITTHIYTCSAPGVTGFLSQFKVFGKPIWLTEFDCPNTGDLAKVSQFLSDTLPLLDADPAYARYSWFGTRVAPFDTNVGTEVSIFNPSSNALTVIGNTYITPPSSSTTAAPTVAPPTTPAPTTRPTTAAPTTQPTTRPPTTSSPTASTTAAPSPIPGKVTIRSLSNSMYVLADSTTGDVLTASVSAAAASVFTVSSVASGGYTFWSVTLNYFVCADNAGASPLIANRQSASSWENFSITKQSNGYYTITSTINGMFVAVQSNNNLLASVTASANPPNSALFTLTTHS